MEGKTNKGGKRVGAGRKPLPILEKKSVLTLYPSNADLYKFGDKKKMAEAILKFIAAYGNDSMPKELKDRTKAELYTEYVRKEPVAIQDLNKQTQIVKPIEPLGIDKTNYTIDTTPKVVQPLISRFEHHKAIILKTETIPQLESALKAAKTDLLNGRERIQLEQIAKQHSTTMYND